MVSLDVGYTLGEPRGTTLTQRLVELSPLPAGRAKRLAQQILHPLDPRSDTTGVRRVCEALAIAPGLFPHDHDPPEFDLWAGAKEAVARISQFVPVVTLSNVSHWDECESDISGLLTPHLRAHHPSWRLGYAKPDRRAVQTVARLHGFGPAEVLHVGDSFDYDVRGALAAGARALWITTGVPTAEENGLLAQHPGRVALVPDLPGAVRFIERIVHPSTRTTRSVTP
ncbi:HAD family hydrolase [Streptomyces sp. NPDC001255]|uniref:HAD family hydrolase n=1 Tax=Streptomyces sp. NPDC001255 TaxID=3364550 RepID=UPI0036C63030